MAKAKQSFSEQIRRAIDQCGVTRYRICKTVRMAESTMSRFMAGKQGLSLKALDRIADLIGLRVTLDNTGKGKGH